MNTNDCTLEQAVLSAVRSAHREVGAAACAGSYGRALERALIEHEIPYQRRVWAPERYKGLPLNCGYVADFVIDNALAIVTSEAADTEPETETRLVHVMRALGLRTGFAVAFGAEGEPTVRRLDYSVAWQDLPLCAEGAGI